MQAVEKIHQTRLHCREALTARHYRAQPIRHLGLMPGTGQHPSESVSPGLVEARVDIQRHDNATVDDFGGLARVRKFRAKQRFDTRPGKLGATVGRLFTPANGEVVGNPGMRIDPVEPLVIGLANTGSWALWLNAI